MNRQSLALLFISFFPLLCFGTAPEYEFGYLYQGLPFEMPHVERPVIPANEMLLTDFGARGDGMTLNTAAFENALTQLSSQGGGRLVVPAGVWFTGPIVLRSNIDLHLEAGALILFTDNMNDYPLVSTNFEGLETRRCQSPLWAKDAVNISITGHGVIDGAGQAWRPVKKGKLVASEWSKLVASGGVLNARKDTWFPSEKSRYGSEISDMNVPRNLGTDTEWESVKDFLRPVMVSLQNCENVLLEGVTFQNSPSWNIHPFMCRNLIVKSVTVRNPWYAQNGDGLDVESCTNVIIVDSSFDVGDDGICIKSGKDAEGRKRGIPAKNIIVDNCTVFHGHGGFVVGSEMSGGVKNISVTNCTFLGTDVGLRFKSNRGRGGVVEDIYIKGIRMMNIPTEPLLFDLFYGGKSASEELADGKEPQEKDAPAMKVDQTTPSFRNIHISDVVCHGSRRAMFFNGLPEMNVRDVYVDDCSISATYGVEISESDGVRLSNLRLEIAKGPELKMTNVKNVEVDGIDAAKVELSGSRNASVKVNSKELIAVPATPKGKK